MFDENAAPHLKTIMEVGGAHPRKGQVDYQTCFRRSIPCAELRAGFRQNGG